MVIYTSLWGATIITNLLSAIRYIGKEILQWVWGGFAVDSAALIRFFALHFLISFVIIAIVIIHLLVLHQIGSNNPLELNKNTDKIPFHPYFTLKDILGFAVAIIILILTLKEPYIHIYYIGKVLEENGGSLNKTLIWRFTRGNDENSARTVRVPAEIRRRHLSNISLEGCLYTTQVGFIKHV